MRLWNLSHPDPLSFLSVFAKTVLSSDFPLEGWKARILFLSKYMCRTAAPGSNLMWGYSMPAADKMAYLNCMFHAHARQCPPQPFPWPVQGSDQLLFPCLSTDGLGGELPISLLPRLALWSCRGSGFFHSGGSFPYPVVSIILAIVCNY